MKGRSIVYFCLFFLLINFTSCRFFNSIDETINPDYNSKVTAVEFNKSLLNIDIGESEYLEVTLSGSEQNKCDVEWEYDEELLEVVPDKYGVIITGKKAGGTYIKASCNGIIATCLISVLSNGDIGLENSYIFSNDSVVQLKPGNVQTVTVGLYGGDTTDMEFFEWKINDSSIAEISYSRNNCIITAKKTGHTQITVSHPDSKYDYTFIVYIYQDNFDITFITTSQNVVCLDKNNPTDAGGRLITVSLVNPITPNYQGDFKWSFADNDSKNIVSISGNSDSCLITPLSNGVAKINVTHKNAADPISIIVRVSTIVQNTYINVSSSTLIVDGSDTFYSITANIENYDDFVNPDKFVWGYTDEKGKFTTTFPSSVTELCDITSSGNKIQILGKKNGSFKITVSHEIAEYKRSILVILTNQIGNAIDSSMYITTSDNYIITQNGAKESTITVTLSGGNPGDEKDFEWYINGENIVWNGEYKNNIANITYVDGNVFHNSRAIANSEISGKLIIDPEETNTPGTLDITIKHPRCLYDCNITVKVYSKYAQLTKPIIIRSLTDTPIKIENGQNIQVSASLENAKVQGENEITWVSNNPEKVSVTAKGSTSVFTACGIGNGQTYVTVDYNSNGEKAEGALQLLVLTGDTLEAIESMKYISSSDQYIRLNTQTNNTQITVNCGGAFTNSDKIEWKSENSGIVRPMNSTSNVIDGKSSTFLEGIKEGKTKVTAKLYNDTSNSCNTVSFDITVLPVGEEITFIEAPKFLSTSKTAVVLETIGDMENLYVNGTNISPFEMLNTQWTIEDKETENNDGKNNFDISGQGENVTITANKKGKSVITVTNPVSSNEININAKCGNILEWTENYTCFITTENDVFNISKDNKTYTIGATLENVTSTTHKWEWKVTKGNDIVEIAESKTNAEITSTCILNVKEAGQAIITIKNDEAITEKEILINVANSKAELSSLVYLTTSDNVVAVGKGSSKTVSVSLVNTKENIVSGYVWEVTSGNNLIDVASSGTTAVIYGKECGTSKIRVSNPENCTYPIELIVNTVDPHAILDDPYISSTNIVTVSVSGSNATLTADLIGGTELDNSNFTWTIDNPSVAKLYPSNNTAEIKGLQEGSTQIVITHPKATYSRTILVIVEAKTVSSCFIQLDKNIVSTTPGGSDTTISATLVNGNPEDVYNFKWWSSDYNKINIDYTGQHCVITPLSSGTVTIYCSHPKAANDVTAILRISNFSTFAFEDAPTISVEAQSINFLNLETPAEYIDSGHYVQYTSSNPNVCVASMPSGNSTSVCILETKNTTTQTSATITATVMDKAGQSTGKSAQLLVNISPKDKNKSYLSINTSQTITIQKGSKSSFTVSSFETKDKTLEYLIGNEVSGNTWKTASDYKYGIVSINKKDSSDGKSVFQITAEGSGTTTIKIRNKECVYPLTVYIYVPGSDEPSVTLNYSKLPLFLGDSPTNVTATVTNSSATPKWTCVDSSGKTVVGTYVDLVEKSNKAILTPIALGKATLKATITDNGKEYSASCEVNVREVAKISLYTFKDETNRTGRQEIKTLYVYPGQSKVLHYDILDADGELDEIKSIVSSSNQFQTFSDLGNKGCSYKGITYPKGVGTIVFTSIGEGMANFAITSKSNVAVSVTVSSDYNYLFTVDKTYISEYIPSNNATGELSAFQVNYQLRPATAKIRVCIPNNIYSSVECKNIGNLVQSTAIDGTGTKVYEFSPLDMTNTSYDVDTGIVSGTINFNIKGEFSGIKTTTKDNREDYTNVIKVRAVNYDVVQTGTNKNEKYDMSSHYIEMQYIYNTKNFNFVTEHDGNYPYNLNLTTYRSPNVISHGYSTIKNGAIIIGDGEVAHFRTKINNAPLSNVELTAEIEKATVLSQKVGDITYSFEVSSAHKSNGKNATSKEIYVDYYLKHEKDYGYYKYSKNNAIITHGENKSEYYDENNTVNAVADSINETVRKHVKVGTLKIKNKKDNTIVYLNIPVYLDIRNTPCMTVTSLYNTDYTETSWVNLLNGN